MRQNTPRKFESKFCSQVQFEQPHFQRQSFLNIGSQPALELRLVRNDGHFLKLLVCFLEVALVQPCDSPASGQNTYDRCCRVWGLSTWRAR